MPLDKMMLIAEGSSSALHPDNPRGSSFGELVKVTQRLQIVTLDGAVMSLSNSFGWQK